MIKVNKEFEIKVTPKRFKDFKIVCKITEKIRKLGFQVIIDIIEK